MAETVKLTFLGDILWNKPMTDQLDRYAAGEGHDFSGVFAPLKPFLEGSDYVMGNLEGTMSPDKTQRTVNRWEYCMTPDYGRAIRDCGIDYLSTANNHCLDRGIRGIESTIRCLDELGFDHSGTYLPGEKRKEPLLVDIGGVKLGVLAYTYGTNTLYHGRYLRLKQRRLVDLIQEQEGKLATWDPLCAYVLRRPGGRAHKLRDRLADLIVPDNMLRPWNERETWGGYRRWLLQRDIKNLRRRGADKIALFLHIGGQFKPRPIDFTLRMTRWVESMGVDFVIGNHEHVIHGSRLKGGQVTTYALGNLLGCSGILMEPMDRRSEYSIALHGYVDKNTKKTERITYSVMKTHYTPDGKFEIWPVFALLQTLSGEEREKVLEEARLAAYDFSGVLPQNVEKEFVLAEGTLWANGEEAWG